MSLILSNTVYPLLAKHTDPFNQVMQLSGEVFRDQKNRRTQKINQESLCFFIKQHFGSGFKEWLKCLINRKPYIAGANNEWFALGVLTQLGIACQQRLGYGKRGWLPFYQRSFIMTKALPELQPLDQLHQRFANEPAFKQACIAECANILRKMHLQHLYHYDCYACHFLWSEHENRCYVIDLHRAVCKRKPHRRSQIKDLGALIFSFRALGFSDADCQQFLNQYWQQQPSLKLIRKVFAYANKLEKRPLKT